jgi:hypothetical protein
VAVERIAEEIARDALSDEAFRRSLRELVRQRSRTLLDELVRNGARRTSRHPRAKPARRRPTRSSPPSNDPYIVQCTK